MIPLADLHVHLLAGLDDGPRNWDDALAMCQIAVAEGTRYATALSHQNERWQVSPEAIRTATKELASRLEKAGVPLTVFPAAEVMATTDLPQDWKAGRLLSYGDHGQHLLLEMPHGLFVDLRPTIHQLSRLGLQVVLAHPERHPELLHDPGRIEELIELGCLVQVSSGSVTAPRDRNDQRAIRGWFRRGCVHLLGSDGHSPRKRQPQMAAAYEQIRRWTGAAAADRICGSNGLAILRGEPVQFDPPRLERQWWPLRLLG